MRRFALISGIILVLGITGIRAQQIPQHTQYMFNDFTMNPAVAGSKDYYLAVSNNRYQWVGIVDAPRTYVLSVYGPHKSKSMGFGGYIFNDVTGPTSRMGVNASYAYQFKLSGDINMSLGLSVGLLQYRVDVSKISFREVDNAVLNNMYTDYVPDANFGLLVYSGKWFGGLAANQLINNRIKLYSSRAESETRLKTHISAMGGYKFEINEQFTIEPSVLIKYVSPAPPQFDINAKVIYKKDIWGGISYRHADAVAVMVGYELLDQIFFGYAYDFSTTTIRKHSSGTHELMIGAKFNKIKEEESELSIQ